MRLGCLGCLTVLIVVALVAGGAWFGFRILQEPAALPASWLQRRIWLDASGRARVEPGATRRERRYLRLDVTEFAVGRQRLPAMLLRFLLNPAALRVLRWPLPEGIEAVTVEAGRVVIRTAS